MSRKNLIILIIALAVIMVVFFGFFYLYQPSSPSSGGNTGTNFFASFLPFGKGKTNTPTSPANISGSGSSSPTENTQLKLKKISSMPIAGYGLFTKERLKDISANPTINNTLTTPGTTSLTEFTGAVKYTARATGNIYQTFTDTINERNFSTMIVPQIYEAYFTNNMGSVILRYLKDNSNTIETVIGTLPKKILGVDTPINKMNTSFLPENITDLSTAPDTSNIFYLFNVKNGSVGISADGLGNNKVQIFSSAFTEWLSQYPNSKTITLTTKPSANVPGYMYFINPNKKGLNKVLGGINGLTTLTSPNGKLVLYSGNDLALNIYNIDTNKVISAGVKTLPEKCVWSKFSDKIYCAVPKSIDQGDYPDTWYQGEVSFTDDIWQIDPFTGNTYMMSDLTSTTGGEAIDGIKLAIEDSGNNLFFVNKKDSYLWELNLK